MKIANAEVISLLGILEKCMAKRQEEEEVRSVDEIKRFKKFLNHLSPNKRESIVEELQRYVWLNDVI